MEMGLVIFATMQPGLPTIRLAHSIVHITGGDWAHHGQDVVFMGDCLGWRFPQAYTLPEELPCQWHEYRFVENLMGMKTHYKMATSDRALWTPADAGGTKVKKKLLKMLLVPLEWVEWL